MIMLGAIIAPEIALNLNATIECLDRTFEKYDRDFYKIDPLLFSPAQITFVNLSTGRHFQFGQTNIAVLQESFGS